MNNNPKNFPLSALVFVLLISLLFSCEKTLAQPTNDPAGVVMKNCTICHSPGRICDSLGKMDRKAWNETVKRMVGHGADISKQDIPVVVDYLTSLKSGSPPVCK